MRQGETYERYVARLTCHREGIECVSFQVTLSAVYTLLLDGKITTKLL